MRVLGFCQTFGIGKPNSSRVVPISGGYTATLLPRPSNIRNAVESWLWLGVNRNLRSWLTEPSMAPLRGSCSPNTHSAHMLESLSLYHLWNWLLNRTLERINSRSWRFWKWKKSLEKSTTYAKKTTAKEFFCNVEPECLLVGIWPNCLVWKLKAGLNNWFMRKREFHLEFPDRPRTRKKRSPHPYTEIWVLHENLLAKLLLIHGKA